MTLDRDSWARVQVHFDALVELEPADRQAALEELELEPADRRLLESLLTSHDQADPLLDSGSAPALLALAESEPVDRDWTGRRIGPWQVDGRIGRGGMSVVHRGRRDDGQFEKTVAIKVLDADQLAADQRHRLAEEVRILARLEHSGLARLIDSGESDDGDPYLVMEYVQGMPLHEHVEQNALDAGQRVELIIQIARALHYAHQRQVIHCDINPSQGRSRRNLHESDRDRSGSALCGCFGAHPGPRSMAAASPGRGPTGRAHLRTVALAAPPHGDRRSGPPADHCADQRYGYRSRSGSTGERPGRARDFLIELLEAADPTLEFGHDPTASELLRRGAERTQNQLSEQPDLLIELLYIIGKTQLERGLIDDARSSLDRAIDTMGEHRDHPDAAAVLASRGLVAYESGLYERSVDWLAQAVSVAEDHRISKDDRHAILVQLADMQVVNFDPDPALEITARVLADQPGMDNRIPAMRVRGGALEISNRLEEAEEILTEALALQNEIMPIHINAAKIENDLGLVYWRLRDYERAVAMQEASWQHKIEIYGEDHPQTLVVRQPNNCGFSWSVSV